MSDQALAGAATNLWLVAAMTIVAALIIDQLSGGVWATVAFALYIVACYFAAAALVVGVVSIAR